MSFTDFIQLQEDVAGVLLGDAWLGAVNIITRERLIFEGNRMPDEALMVETLAYLTERNGKRGCGVIVEKPRFAVTLPNVPGPQGQLVVSCLVIEDPLENEGPTGTGQAADQVGQRILDVLHHWVLDGVGIFRAEGDNALSPATEWEPLRAYTARVVIDANRGQTPRVARVVAAGEGAAVTLSSGTVGCLIYYTLDGSFPAPGHGTLYEGPVDATGMVLRAVGYMEGLVPSAVLRKRF
jgi:hypothetical protein